MCSGVKPTKKSKFFCFSGQKNCVWPLCCMARCHDNVQDLTYNFKEHQIHRQIEYPYVYLQRRLMEICSCKVHLLTVVLLKSGFAECNDQLQLVFSSDIAVLPAEMWWTSEGQRKYISFACFMKYFCMFSLFLFNISI